MNYLPTILYTTNFILICNNLFIYNAYTFYVVTWVWLVYFVLFCHFIHIEQLYCLVTNIMCKCLSFYGSKPPTAHSKGYLIIGSTPVYIYILRICTYLFIWVSIFLCFTPKIFQLLSNFLKKVPFSVKFGKNNPSSWQYLATALHLILEPGGKRGNRHNRPQELSNAWVVTKFSKFSWTCAS